jgi:hypothetical protein
MGDAANTAPVYRAKAADSWNPGGADQIMGMKPVTIALDGDTASYLVLALKEELAGEDLRATTARVYNEVIDAIVAALDPVEAGLHPVDREDEPPDAR